MTNEPTYYLCASVECTPPCHAVMMEENEEGRVGVGEVGGGGGGGEDG